MKTKLLIAVTFALSYLGFTQEYYLKHYQVDKGLSHNSVITSIQDTNGFLWFGTKNGLNRFDGYTFKLYHNDPMDTTSIGSNYIQAIIQDKQALWVGTDNGLYHFDQVRETFTLMDITLNKSIRDIETDHNGNLWFIAGGTLYSYNSVQNKYTVFDTADFFQAVSITKDENGDLWVASFNQIYKYQPNSHSFTPMNIQAVDDGFPFVISTIFSLNQHKILLGTQNHGVLSFNSANGEQKQLLTKEKAPIYVRNFALKGAHELWIASENGVYVYNLQTGQYDHLQKQYSNHYSLSDNAVYTITVDNEQGVWMGTYFRGINYYPKQYTPFKKYVPKFNVNSISGNIVRELAKDQNGNLWIGTEDAGLNKLNLKTGEITNFNPLKNKSCELSYHNIHGLLPDGEQLWVGTFEHGLDVIDINSGKLIKHFGTGNNGGLNSNFVFDIHKNIDGDILAVTTDGIQMYNKEKDQFVPYPKVADHLFYNSVLELTKEQFWVGSYRNGVFYYNTAKNEKHNFKYDSKDPQSISSNAINDIFKDSKGRIWITTENGLNLYRPESNDFKRFNLKNAFPCNVVYSILEDEKGNLWISSSNGLIRFNPSTLKTKVFTQANGLSTDQFNYKSAYKDTNGTMYFGCVDGMISFNPNDFVNNIYTPPLVLTELKMNNKTVEVSQKNSPLSTSISYSDQLKMDYKQSSFSISFAALSYYAPQMTTYWYKLEGLGDTWLELSNSQTAYFTKLAPGDYTLKYKALNNNGTWSYGKDLKIKITPPYWASTTAYILYFIVGAALLFFSIRNYHRQTAEKNRQKIRQLNNKKEKEVYQAKIEFFTNVAHEIRTPLTLIKSPLEKILKSNDQSNLIKENLAIMSKNTSRLLDLVNQLLDFRRTEIEEIKLSFVKTDLIPLLNHTLSRFSQAIQERSLEVCLQHPKEELYANIDAEAFKKIMSNLINNAIKYAHKNISITLKNNQENFQLIIKNDGDLIPVQLKDKIFEPFYRLPEAEHKTGTGIGLSLAHSLTELHKGTLELSFSDPAMNCFILEIPLYQETVFTLYHNEEKEIIPDIKSEPNKTETGTDPTVQSTQVLLVEDNVDLLDFIAKDLSESYNVLTATSAEYALEILESEKIGVVISDVMMPGISGFELCKHIKTTLKTSHIPVIMLTSKTAITAKVEGLESGADAYIEKPFSMEYLHVQVKNLLENRKHIMKHYSSSPLAHIRSIAHSKTDENFIKTLDNVIDQNISDHHLSVEILAEIMHMSRSTLYRKIKDISDLSPNELINITRLKKAAELLSTGDYKIYEVSEMVGYNSQTSFGRNFQKQFHMTPTEYLNTKVS
ncbi:hybrid sensor histidine kinase/response regulator transcription factor [Galbibacter sp.]|uniref:hybrid sensor histidine kinase/response regulator transcription factor n=1 Tax=Galbibacter sp. TaxID=2918471 RepID=UPI003A926DCA